MKFRNSVDKDFSLGSEWALKETQKFGKKGGARIAKNIVSLLQAFFHAGNANRSDRYSARSPDILQHASVKWLILFCSVKSKAMVILVHKTNIYYKAICK
jgi:hypothetical protein